MTDEIERFFIDHDMIHDRVTGKHVDPTPVEFAEGEFDDSPTLEACALLNELHSAAIASIRKDDELREWALEKCAQHHRLAVENEELRTEHIASSSAYRELANELERRSALSSVAGGGG